MTTATTGEGIPALLSALGRHRAVTRDGVTRSARRARAESQVRSVLMERLQERLAAPVLATVTDEVIDAVAGHDLDPYAAADRLLAALFSEEPR